MTNGEIKLTDSLWELSNDQAQEFLKSFLETEHETFQSLKVDLVILDYSVDSVVNLAHHVVKEIIAGHLDEEQQNVWFIRLGYYFGESLRKFSPRLSWVLGNPEYAFSNHPVLIGFADGMEAPMITICRNIIESVVEGFSPSNRINAGIEHWFSPTKLV
jgi:hypothetical protein